MRSRWAEDYRRSWFLTYRPPPGETGHVALVALAVATSERRAVWTYTPSVVSRIGAFVERQF